MSTVVVLLLPGISDGNLTVVAVPATSPVDASTSVTLMRAPACAVLAAVLTMVVVTATFAEYAVSTWPEISTIQNMWRGWKKE